MDVWSQDHADHKKRIKRSNGTKGTANNAPEDIRELEGNLRFPIDFTYHGDSQLWTSSHMVGQVTVQAFHVW